MVEKKRREVYKINIGPIFKKVLNKQRDNIKKSTYDVCPSSDWEACEILGKKILESNLV